MICPAKSAQELLSEFRTTGRQEPFEEIVRRYAAMVFHVCFQVLKNRHDAEDATQAVFLTLAVQGKTSKEIRNIGPWLQQVAKRLSLDLRKSRSRRAAREHRHGLDNCNGTTGLALGTGLDSQELRHILSEELNQLAPKYRLPLILHYFGGLSREQMSQELGCKAATLGVRLHRGREMLAVRLSQRGVALTVGGLGLLLSYLVREAVSDSMVWSTSHVASQMAAGHPIGAGIVSARALALAHSAGTTLAIAKIKAIVAAVLIAATAVAASEMVSKVRPMDLRFQSPAGDRLMDLLRPKLPQIRTDATPPEATPTPPAVVIAPEPTPPAVSTQITVAIESPTPFEPARDAAWGGSILGGRWIGSATTTHIPGIIWSTAGPPPQGFASNYTGRGYAVGPLAAPIARPGMERPSSPFMGNPGVASPPFATVPQKPRRPATPGTSEEPKRLKSTPAANPFSAPMELVFDDGPKLFLGPAIGDGRTHPRTPVSTPSSTSSAPVALVSSSGEVVTFVAGAADHVGGLSFRIDSGQLVANAVTGFSTQNDAVYAGSSSESFVVTLNDSGNYIFHPQRATRGPGHHVPPPPKDDDPIMLARSAFDGVSTISTSLGIISGYGTANRASELNQSGQVIADGHGQPRTLDLSPVRIIKNSTDNSRTGHNGWFAQNQGKLVLPAVAFNNNVANWAEDAADSSIDLVNSVRLRVDHDVVGSIKLALLAPDRTDYPALPVHLNAIGLWEVEPLDLVLGSVDVTVRYDADLAGDLRLGSNLSLWGYDGQWRLAEGISLDSYNRLIRGRLGDINYLAVAGSPQQTGHINSTPEPAAMLGLVCTGLLLARRRRIRL
ncbi:MAG TPA: sigma-70 family RNA polymerase sigma factor [Tepidisphaeraceae bacterium]|nr:sigma-70 family RNA polymerase sigma factor [Tepidisphaeraceae bacterium]